LKGLVKGIDYKYVVTDIAGAVIVENQSLASELIDLSLCSNGIYFATISTSNGNKTYKLVNMK
jgi:3-oxoacyl-[acyl-carrier-protein] synthase III